MGANSGGNSGANSGVTGVCSDNIVFSPIFAPTGDIFQ